MKVLRQMTATLAGQVATLTPKAGTLAEPDQLTITTATVTFAANAATFIDTLSDYDLVLLRKTKAG